MAVIRIIVVEDDDSLRQSIADILMLNEGFEVVGCYPNGEGIVQAVQKLRPDVILMDIDMPVINGITAVKEIRQSQTEYHIIMLTVFEDNDNVLQAMYAGANGYLLKKDIAEKLIASIKEVLAGGAPMSSNIARLIVESMHRTGKTSATYQLTFRENEVLQSLSKGNSYKMIAADLDISVDTVRTHIRRIYEKLNVHSQSEALMKAVRDKMI